MAEEESDYVVFSNVISADLGGWSLFKPFAHSKFDFDSVLKKLHSQYGVDALFSVRVGIDDKNSSANIIKIAPAGLGLPQSEFYLDDKYANVRIAFNQLNVIPQNDIAFLVFFLWTV
ncbi:endothelin-converting enzyme 1-like protein [Leptotrombidium deliense]|uniref:Endothelin-converting enzyme 1-like protein n=1 Tax=Leptotrombidium deliense TaxID=299467 RepID=A0A443RWG0_9ACAR|nr:endothelin-converting enzyme 1-like protein [Leptotrombidium deliense]